MEKKIQALTTLLNSLGFFTRVLPHGSRDPQVHIDVLRIEEDLLMLELAPAVPIDVNLRCSYQEHLTNGKRFVRISIVF